MLASGLRFADFKWQELADDSPLENVWPALVHEPSKSYFQFLRSLRTNFRSHGIEDVGHAVRFSPGSETRTETHEPLPMWEDVLYQVQQWLKYLRAELAAPLWESIADGSQVDSSAATEDEEPYSEEEQREIGAELDEVLQRLSVVEGLHRDSVGLLRSEFAEVKAELSSMKRGRWRKLFMGTLFNLALRQVIPVTLFEKALVLVKALLFRPPGPGFLPPMK